MEMHYSDDLSLSEIAESLSITRQAVHDSLKRGENTLKTYEEKLGLVERYFEIGKRINTLKEKAQSAQIEKAYKEIYDDILALLDKWEY